MNTNFEIHLHSTMVLAADWSTVHISASSWLDNLGMWPGETFPLVTADPASPEFLQVRFCKSVSQVYDRTQRVKMILFIWKKLSDTTVHIMNPRKFNWRNLPTSMSGQGHGRGRGHGQLDTNRGTWTWTWTWAEGHGQGRGHGQISWVKFSRIYYMYIVLSSSST
jgi:hypothetical protein